MNTQIQRENKTAMATLVNRLAAVDSSAVSDALDRLQLHGAVVSLRALSVSKRIAGQAITVQLGPANGQAPARHLCTAAVDASGPGRVIVIAHNARTDVSGWGGILSLGAVMRGAEGVVVDGACRDLDESRDLGLPVYARAAVPVTARGRIIELSWNEPVQFDGVKVSPGDLVIADASGVVFVPLAHAEQAITIAEEIYAREREMAEAARSGKPMAEVMGAKYERMLKTEQGS